MRYALISTYSAALLAGTSLVAPGAAFAAGSADQSSDPSGSQSAEVESTSGLVGDIIVTASRREQSVTSVPYNISAVTAEALSRNGVTDIGKLARSVPGVAMIDRGAREAGMNNTIVIRGITT